MAAWRVVERRSERQDGAGGRTRQNREFKTIISVSKRVKNFEPNLITALIQMEMLCKV